MTRTFLKFFRLARTYVSDAQTVRFFGKYLGIGAVVMAVDLGCFAFLMRFGTPLASALTVAYVLAVAVHFYLNRVTNFRNFDRAVHLQLRTYAAVVFVSWIITLGVTEAGFRLLGLAPFVAKLCAVVINIPVGFLGLRYLAFGPGITHTFKLLYSRMKDRNQSQIAKRG